MNAKSSIFAEIRDRLKGSDTTSQSMMQRMRRCFMTGKQCIFCTQSGLPGGLAPIEERDSVFVIMPFRPNLDTFFEWSLKRYLADFGIPKENIRRADNYSDTGYIMCEKICRRIQEAGVVAVDLSLEDPNIYYELGISIGLGKPLILLCDKDRKGKDETSPRAAVWKSVGIDWNRVIAYPNVGFLYRHRDERLAERVVVVPLKSRKSRMELVPLLVADRKPSDENTNEEQIDDIEVTFVEAVRAAIGVAIDEIEDKVKPRSPGSAPITVSSEGERHVRQLRAVVEALREGTAEKNGDQLLSLRNPQPHFLRDENGNCSDFAETAERVDGSFACIIDLAGEDALSYFWLGYCHARNINVIPVHRKTPHSNDSQQASTAVMTLITNHTHCAHHEPVAGEIHRPFTTPADKGRKENHVLAFDIRALWCVGYDEKHPRDLANTLRAVLEELLIKDVMTQERRGFWERLTRSGQIHIFTGAVHHDGLSREVVGDWDLRTVSELVQYLSSTEESVVPVLENPVYGPETISVKLNGRKASGNARSLGRNHAQILDDYVRLIEDELKKKRNCLIVASADVNPLTEVVLGHAYRKEKCDKAVCFQEPDPDLDDGYAVVALKKQATEKVPKRRFCRGTLPGRVKTLIDANKRGFYLRRKADLVPYRSQDGANNQFHVLAHLLVMRNPFPRREGQDEGTIVVLNGVSGPGTYALAQMLTGGARGEKARDSERLLREINRMWDSEVADEPRLRGVEAIIDVTISPPSKTPERASKATRRPAERLRVRVQDKFFDKRVVTRWDFRRIGTDVAADGKSRSADKAGKEDLKRDGLFIKTFPVLD